MNSTLDAKMCVVGIMDRLPLMVKGPYRCLKKRVKNVPGTYP